MVFTHLCNAASGGEGGRGRHSFRASGGRNRSVVCSRRATCANNRSLPTFMRELSSGVFTKVRLLSGSQTSDIEKKKKEGGVFVETPWWASLTGAGAREARGWRCPDKARATRSTGAVPRLQCRLGGPAASNSAA